MPNEDKLKISESVMSQIRSGKVKIIPRWKWFIVSAAFFVSVVGIFVTLVFLVSLIIFSIRKHGPMGSIRLQQLLDSFPWWAPVLAILGLWCEKKIARHYDFSYKKNYQLLTILFIVGVIFSGFLVDYTGLDMWLMRRGQMRRFYEKDAGGSLRMERPYSKTPMNVRY